MDQLGALLPLILLAAVFYLLILRPARKRQQQQRETVAALAPGQEVMTASGIFARVSAVSEERITLEIADGVTMQVTPAAVSRVIPAPAAEDLPESIPASDDLDLSGDRTTTEGDTPAR